MIITSLVSNIISGVMQRQQQLKALLAPDVAKQERTSHADVQFRRRMERQMERMEREQREMISQMKRRMQEFDMRGYPGFARNAGCHGAGHLTAPYGVAVPVQRPDYSMGNALRESASLPVNIAMHLNWGGAGREQAAGAHVAH